MVKFLDRLSRLIFTAVAPVANPLDDRYYPVTGSFLSRAGVRVDEDSATRVSTVYRCVAILSNILAGLPKGMYERLERGRKEAPDHPLDPVISFRPNRRQSAFEFWRQVYFQLVLRQNAYVQIIPGPSGRGWVGELYVLNPGRISGPEVLDSGKLRYIYTKPDGTKQNLIGGIDMWHIPGLSGDGLKGLSMLDVASESVGSSIAAERQAGLFFSRGVKANGVLQHPGHLDKQTASDMSESFGRSYGGEGGMGKVPVLWEDMKFVSTSLNLKDQEFLDSRKFSVAEIARWFGVPPYMVGDVERSTSWGTGMEEQELVFLVFSLGPWIELVEQSIRFALVVQPDRYYPKFNAGGLLRMKAEVQANVISKYIEWGVYSPNDARELLERNPRQGGDEYRDPTKVAAPSTPPKDAPPEPTQPSDSGTEERARLVASARAAELLDEEARGLRRLATEHAKNAAAWPAAVAGYYGKFAGRVVAAMVCSKDAARNWCETRRGIVLAEGMANLTGNPHHGEALAALTDLALAPAEA